MLNLQELSEKGVLFDGHYKLLRPLSTDGATADVWLAIDVNTIDSELDGEPDEKKESTGMKVAIKVYRPKNALDIEGEQRFRDEYKIVYECRHANLLQPTGFSIYGDYPYLVLPFCQNGSSEKLVGKGLKEDEIWKYILDVSSGLNRLHTNDPQIVHQDIKPANILIDKMHDYAITDFGISSRRGGVHGYYDDNSGTMAYMAPERFLEDAEPMPQSDIWGFGATLFEILTGKVPFGEEGGKAQQSSKDSMPPMPGVPAAIQRLVHACLDFEPGNRPTAQQLMEAARQKQFPVKNKKWLWISLSAVFVLMGGAVLWLLLSRNTHDVVVADQRPIEESFELAKKMMDSRDTNEFFVGYRMMDSLCYKVNYIPAMYEMVLTFGWNENSEYVRRKDLLKIEYDEKKNPKDPKYNSNVFSLADRILKCNDSSQAEINMKVAYILGVYYYKVNAERDDSTSQKYFDEALGWAEYCGDTAFILNYLNS